MLRIMGTIPLETTMMGMSCCLANEWNSLNPGSKGTSGQRGARKGKRHCKGHAKGETLSILTFAHESFHLVEGSVDTLNHGAEAFTIRDLLVNDLLVDLPSLRVSHSDSVDHVIVGVDFGDGALISKERERQANERHE